MVDPDRAGARRSVTGDPPVKLSNSAGLCHRSEEDLDEGISKRRRRPRRHPLGGEGA